MYNALDEYVGFHDPWDVYSEDEALQGSYATKWEAIEAIDRWNTKNN